MKAFVWRTGLVEFGRSVPSGAIEVPRGPARVLRARMSVLCRHAYDGKSLLVPGIPEAENDEATMNASKPFKEWIAPNFSNKEARHEHSRAPTL